VKKTSTKASQKIGKNPDFLLTLLVQNRKGNFSHNILYKYMTEKYNILYVDDEKQNLHAFRAIFRRFFNVYIASGGSEALAILENQTVHLVLSDQRMPVMTGVELCENVMQMYPESVRMIVTGYSEMDPILNAINEGKISSYIMKPWKTQELKSIMESAIQQSA